MAGALRSLGIKKGDRVASFSLNNHRHMELYFGVPCMGAVLHTLNIRLSAENLVYIINHAEDRILFIDEDVYFLIEPLKDQLKTVEQYVIMSQSGVMPQTTLSPVVLYDDLIKDFPDTYDFPVDRDENEPCLICYTSATTGDPKGVVYSHRGLVPAFFCHSASPLGTQEKDCALHIVPMFHANAWGAPFAGAMTRNEAGAAGKTDSGYGGIVPDYCRRKSILFLRCADHLDYAPQSIWKMAANMIFLRCEIFSPAGRPCRAI
ncbi:MAG: AMP-binding protein [Desulfobacterales bacterium]|nr:AMP-binding protein [Desulfobacterales bacterium]